MREGPRMRGPEKQLQQPPWISPARWAARRLPPTSMQRQRLSRRSWNERLQRDHTCYVSTEPTSPAPPRCCASLDIVSLALAACLIWTRLWSWLRGRVPVRRSEGSKKGCSGMVYIARMGDDDQPRMWASHGVYNLSSISEQYAKQRFPQYRLTEKMDEPIECEDPYPNIPHDLREQRIQRAQWHLECAELTRYQSLLHGKDGEEVCDQAASHGMAQCALGHAEGSKRATGRRSTGTCSSRAAAASRGVEATQP